MSRHIFEAQMFTLGLDKHPYVKAYADAYYNNEAMNLNESFENISIDKEKLSKLAQRAINVAPEAVLEAYNADYPDLIKATQFATIIVEGPEDILTHEGERYKKRGGNWQKFNTQTGKWEKFKGPLVNKVLLPMHHQMQKDKKASKAAAKTQQARRDELQKERENERYFKQRDEMDKADKQAASDQQFASDLEWEEQQRKEAEAYKDETRKQQRADALSQITQQNFDLDRNEAEQTQAIKKDAEDQQTRENDAVQKMTAKKRAQDAKSNMMKSVPKQLLAAISKLDHKDRIEVISLLAKNEPWADLAAGAILDGNVEQLKQQLRSNK